MTSPTSAEVVARANRRFDGIGGHLATYASAGPSMRCKATGELMQIDSQKHGFEPRQQVGQMT